MEQQWEEAEKILSWREMQPGVYRYHGIECRGTNGYGRPISVVTLEKEGVKMYYAPSSLYWDLKNRSETNFIKYEGTQLLKRAMNILCSNLPNKRQVSKLAVILR